MLKRNRRAPSSQSLISNFRRECSIEGRARRIGGGGPAPSDAELIMRVFSRARSGGGTAHCKICARSLTPSRSRERGKGKAALKYTLLKATCASCAPGIRGRESRRGRNAASRQLGESRGGGSRGGGEDLDQPEPEIVGGRYQSSDGTRNRIGGRGGPFEAGQRLGTTTRLDR